MVSIQKVDTSSKSQVNEFVDFHYKLYKGTPQWVPPIKDDIRLMLNREKHPFYEHSDADFFIARNGQDVVGRIAVLENKAFNRYHNTHKGCFYLFDVVEDQEVANALFDAAFDWCKQRNLDTLVGPKGFSPFDGYGIQIEGFEYRQMMTMMNYNFSYYQAMVEKIGFEKEVDFVSCLLTKEHFHIPEKIHEVARRIEERGKFKVVNFATKRDLIKYAPKIGEAYNKTFVNNWEYWPLTPREVKFTLDSLLTVAVPSLIKIISYNDQAVGFLLGFPDISASLQRHGGNITAWNIPAIADILVDLRRTRSISLNGAGVLPEFQGRGGNALLYHEMEKTLANSRYDVGELTQVANTAVQMRKDLITAGGIPYKNHRVFHRAV